MSTLRFKFKVMSIQQIIGPNDIITASIIVTFSLEKNLLSFVKFVEPSGVNALSLNRPHHSVI